MIACFVTACSPVAAKPNDELLRAMTVIDECSDLEIGNRVSKSMKAVLDSHDLIVASGYRRCV